MAEGPLDAEELTGNESFNHGAANGTCCYFKAFNGSTVELTRVTRLDNLWVPDDACICRTSPHYHRVLL